MADASVETQHIASLPPDGTPIAKRQTMKTFFKLLIISTLLGGYLILACRSGEGVEPDGLIILRVGQTATSPTGVVITADTIQISVCPENAMCIMADHARATLRFVQNGQTQVVRLNSLSRFARRATNQAIWLDSTAVELGALRYKVLFRGAKLLTEPLAFPRNGQITVQVSPL
jgi:hypothetical protein